ncbi:MAG TPA: insulinase family protein, partial [Candidatus Mcinerneyibacterium sp.]|nr:insulinase family protein [Candidatus Mcinerneyibacterium sp.]
MNLKKLILTIFIAFSVSSVLIAADFEVGKEYNGFKLLEKNELKNIDSTGYYFEHTVTKTKLFKLKNNDENKAFSITFKTLPYSDNGIAHVLEHSVLCGSEKFPVKSPFLIMSKGSMSTFLNAMTSSNYTMYPVASPNDKEFYNLMDVYLDAVLNPMIHREDKILKQEGWSYKLENKDAPLKVSGVVYNEMKGALSSPDSLMWNHVQSNLLPGTTYSYESGGKPEAIRTITQKEFEEFHSKYYHPSNGVIYLYGDGNLKEELEFINNNYLSEYNYKDVDSEIKTVEPFKKPVEKEYFYSISKRESTKNKTYHSLSWSIGEISDLELRMAFDILNRVLGQTNG